MCFVNQKTSYEFLISDWSSDVCSSDLTRNQASAALVTGSVSKHALHGIGYTHPGQTEFIAERCGVTATNAVMMLAGPSLRVVPLTVHIPLAEVAERLTSELIVAKAPIDQRGLRPHFGIHAPPPAPAGATPPAGTAGRPRRAE